MSSRASALSVLEGRLEIQPQESLKPVVYQHDIGHGAYIVWKLAWPTFPSHSPSDSAVELRAESPYFVPRLLLGA